MSHVTVVIIAVVIAVLVSDSACGASPPSVPRTTRVMQQPGYRETARHRHDAYLAEKTADPLTHRFPAGVLVSIQREAEVEAARDALVRRPRPGRFCGAASYDGVAPTPQLSMEDIFDPDKLSERTRFKSYPVTEFSLNITKCVGDITEHATSGVHEVHDIERAFAGWKEVIPFIPEGEIWTLTIPAPLYFGTNAIDMMDIPDFCLVTMVVHMENVWSERLPTAECHKKLNAVMGYDVAARDAERAAQLHHGDHHNHKADAAVAGVKRIDSHDDEGDL